MTCIYLRGLKESHVIIYVKFVATDVENLHEHQPL
jgi:hypothetical protein